MRVVSKAFGVYQTNCYIISDKDKDIIIDPGMGAAKWVKDNVVNPVAILNTHGHFDHIWSDCELKKELDIPVYIPKNDAFMLEKDVFNQSQPVCMPDILVSKDDEFDIEGIKVKYIFFPGHTPGCSVIEIGEYWFSGDFIFEGSIGRVDFPYSNPEQMKNSLEKFLKIKYDKKVYTGHGNPTTIKNEQKNVPYWLNYL
jgi:glyoxylase-like metal-dependent hydrolase (beta-lactamase superfamily II)